LILKQLEENGKTSNYIEELSDVAFLQLEIEQFDDSEKNFLICLKHFEKQKDRLGQAAVFGILGTLYFKKGEYKKSNDSYQKASDIYDELKQIPELITCLKGIGNNYIKLNKLDDACDLFFECSSFCSDNNDIYNLLDCLGNLIYIHEKQEKWDIVYELYKKSLKAFKELEDNKGIIVSYFNLGILQKKSNKLDDALRYFKKGTNFAIEANYSELIIKGLGYVGENLFYQGRIKEAKEQYIKALYIAESIKLKNAILQINVLLRSFGLSDEDIKNELEKYKENKNKIRE